MRKFLKKLLEILDGTPAVYGRRQRGQSVLELALVSPLLVILLAGMVEIGWFARNYLVLLEVTRVGARTGTVQQNQLSPVAWNNAASVLPSLDNTFTGGDSEVNNFILRYRNCDASAASSAEFGFYNFLACVMQRSLDPLPFGKGQRVARGADPDGFFPDDIVISAFAVQAVDPLDPLWRTTAGAAMYSDIDWPLGPTGGPQAIVVGRWPTNANECHYREDGSAYDNVNNAGRGVDGRDPFDWIRDNGRNLHPRNASLPVADREQRHYLEIAALDSTVRERQRGFAWTGQHKIAGTGCYGSEWDISDVEDLINLQQFNLTTDQRAYLPSQGVVLVEMWWEHESLSQFVGLAPVISPVFAILGTDTVVEVWAAFPLPQVEPRIDFNQ
jgi:hypothetical protein